ncbi:hypothetical protein B7463_g3914, partial [Scytalidium lignicola]
MSSRSQSRGRSHTRSPYSEESRGHRESSRSLSRPRRTISPRSSSRTPRRNGKYRSESRSRSRSYGRSRSASPVRSTKVVVEKLTKNVNEDHLREIFGTYGTIKDLDMPMNRQFMTNRGTAYILYESEADAEAAIAHMHESQIDGAPGVGQISILEGRRLPLSEARQHLEDVPLRVTTDQTGTLIPTDLDLFRARDLQDVTERVLDLLPQDRVLRLEEEGEEGITLVVVAVGEGEAQAIVAIAVTMSGARVETVDVTVGENDDCGMSNIGSYTI